MNTPTTTTSATTPRPHSDQSSDESSKITHWLGLYEGHLFLNSRPATYERYSRALSKFYEHFPHKRFTYEFLRADLEDYKQQRLDEGASPTTVNIELSILRGFWKWMLRMGADGVFFNPAKGVRVERPTKQRNEPKALSSAKRSDALPITIHSRKKPPMIRRQSGRPKSGTRVNQRSCDSPLQETPSKFQWKCSRANPMTARTWHTPHR